MVKRDENNGWQKASSSLSASAKIYGFKVDNLHELVSRFIFSINRNSALNDGNNEEENQDNQENKKSKSGKKPLIMEYVIIYFKSF